MLGDFWRSRRKIGEPVDLGQTHVEDRDVEDALGDERDRLLAVARLGDLVAGVGERVREAQARGLIVVDDEDVERHRVTLGRLARPRSRQSFGHHLGAVLALSVSMVAGNRPYEKVPDDPALTTRAIAAGRRRSTSQIKEHEACEELVCYERGAAASDRCDSRARRGTLR